MRPHQVELLFAAEWDPAAGDLTGRVQHVFSAGPEATVGINLEDGHYPDVEISRRQLFEMRLSKGDEVAVRVNPSRIAVGRTA